MGAAPKHKQRGTINWILVILLGLVLPIAVVTVVGMMVTSTPRMPKGSAPEASKAAPAPAAPAAAPKVEAKAPAKTEAKTEAKPAAQSTAKPEAKPTVAEQKPQAAAKPTAEATPAAGDKGKAVYTASCAVCHAAAVAGAPKFGDKAAWAPRVKEGNAALHRTAIKGIRAMPPKGGNAALPDEDVKAAVDYMVAAAK